MSTSANSDFECDVLQEQDLESLLRLVNLVFDEMGAQKRGQYDLQHWRWQYSSQFARSINIIAKHKESRQIIASHPNALLPVKYFGDTVTCAVCQDLVTDPRFRGNGVFNRMGHFSAKVLKEEGVAMTYAFPNLRSIGGFLSKHGYQLTAEVPLYVKPVSLTSALESRLGTKWLSPLSRAADVMLSPFKLRKPAPEYSFRPIQAQETEHVNHIWASFRDEHGIAVRRDSDYIRWRFVEKPNNRYKTFLLWFEGKPVGYIVLNPRRVLGVDVLLLMDFGFTESVDHMEALLRFAEMFARDRQLSLLLLMSLCNSKIRRTFRRCRFLRLPSVANRRKMNLVTRANLDPVDAKQIGDPNNWFVTFADWDVF